MMLRTATTDDIGRMMEVYADGRAALGSLGIDQWQDGYPQRWRVEEDVAAGSVRVACDGESIVGCAAFVLAGEADYDDIDGAWLTEGTAEAPCYVVVHRVAAAASSRGRGVASMLLRAAEDVARAEGRKSVRIDTHPGNVPMQRLLAKLGYVRCGIVMLSCTGDTSPVRIAYEKRVR